MPYITQEDRDRIDLILAVYLSNASRHTTLKDLFKYFFVFDKQHPPKSGELNYIITILIHEYVKSKGLCYATLNEVMGVLVCGKEEFYRQVIAPYEDKKARENGCISELDDDSAERIR